VGSQAQPLLGALEARFSIGAEAIDCYSTDRSVTASALASIAIVRRKSVLAASNRIVQQVIARHRNEVPGVAKDCHLVFRITNAHVVPEYTGVEWTVRMKAMRQLAIVTLDIGHSGGLHRQGWGIHQPSPSPPPQQTSDQGWSRRGQRATGRKIQSAHVGLV
jgi:hypothetical protein